MQISEDSKKIDAKIINKMHEYRLMLIANGFYEPTRRESSSWHWLFYKPMTKLTAFIVNLKGTDDFIEIVYGYASTAFTLMAGCEKALCELGVDDSDINIREKVRVKYQSEEAGASAAIKAMNDLYADIEKDELLSIAKERRKAFIKKIAVKMKPLGFKKKNNSWERALEDNFYLLFNAQKSMYSDEYYFNVYIGKYGTDYYGDCYYARVYPGELCPLDWQCISDNELDAFLDDVVENKLALIINTPLKELGKKDFIWNTCMCNREKCESCWVEKGDRENAKG